MDETRRFLRYVTPGIVFVTECVLLLWLILPTWMETHLRLVENISVLLGGLLASGALGFVFSVLHHASHWWFVRLAPDYRPCIERLRNMGAITIVADGNAVSRKIDRAEAWALMSVLWDERRDMVLIKESDAEVKGLNDLFHAMVLAALWIVVLSDNATRVGLFARWTFGQTLADALCRDKERPVHVNLVFPQGVFPPEHRLVNRVLHDQNRGRR